jgi:hypothetical protein
MKEESKNDRVQKPFRGLYLLPRVRAPRALMSNRCCAFLYKANAFDLFLSGQNGLGTFDLGSMNSDINP